MYTQHEAEGKRLKNPFDTIMEGIGINRQTANFGLAKIDGAFKGTDQEAIEMVSKQLPACLSHYGKCVDLTNKLIEYFKVAAASLSFQFLGCLS